MEMQCLEIMKKPEYKNILIMDTIPWGTAFKQRPHQLAEYFSKYYDIVIYKLNGQKKVIKYGDNIMLCPKLKFKKFKNKKITYYIDSINETRDVRFLKKLKRYGYKIVYDYIDEFSNKICRTRRPYAVYRNLEKIKPEVIIAAADKLYKDVEKRFDKNKLVLAKNGVCVQDFVNPSKDFIPKDIKPILEQGKPIVGYYGVISRWLDYHLLSKAAQECPNYNFVYIGKDSQMQVKKLKMHENVYFLGRKEYNELSDYAQFFDCCIIPFKKGKIAKATSPVKLFEYMALRKPIVCTRDLHECKGYEGVLVAQNDEEFIKDLSIAIEMEKKPEIKEKLFNYAQENSWESRANSILNKMRFLWQ